MDLFAVVKIKWKEPEAFRQEQNQLQVAAFAKYWWLRPLIILSLVLMYFGGWLAETFLFHQKPVDLVFGCSLLLPTLIFLTYGMPWLIRRLPASVTLYSNGIMKMGDQYIFPFKGMYGFTWLRKDSYYVLQVVTKKGRILSYGVPDPITKDKIEVALRQNGLKESGR